eukprot:3747990-Prymnesium_polylepis.1
MNKSHEVTSHRASQIKGGRPPGGCKNPSTSHTGRVMSSDEELPPLTADRAGCDITRIAFQDLINSPP